MMLQRDDQRASSHARELDGDGASDARAGTSDDRRGSTPVIIALAQPRGYAPFHRSPPLKSGDELAVQQPHEPHHQLRQVGGGPHARALVLNRRPRRRHRK